MSDPFMRPTSEERQWIFFLEALAFLHDVGKLTQDFLKHEANNDIKFDYERILDVKNVYDEWVRERGEESSKPLFRNLFINNTNGPVNIRNILENLSKYEITLWDEKKYSLAELILLTSQKFGDPKNKVELERVFNKSMSPAFFVGKLHGIAHFEKEGGIKQPEGQNYYAATPFGFESVIENLNEVYKKLPLEWLSTMNPENRLNWLEKLEPQLSKGVADTRRPSNEVSLWDWGYIVASLTKASVAGILRMSHEEDDKKGNIWNEDGEFKDEIPHSVPFCILRITLNRLDVYTHSDKISDLLGVRQTLDESYANVQELLEKDIAIGNKIYHDETGAYFLVSRLGFSDEERRTSLQDEIIGFFPEDLQPHVEWGEDIIGSDLDKEKSLASKLVAEPRKKALEEMPLVSKATLKEVKDSWSDSRPQNSEICTVCGSRPVGFIKEGVIPPGTTWVTQEKAEARHVCQICLYRRGRRAEVWLDSGLSETIWTDEVTDNNGRIALFVGQLGLDGWLDGTLVPTIKVDDKTNKRPSPVRLYRITETARKFWEDMTTEVMPKTIGQRPYRLAIYPSPEGLPGLGKAHSYELEDDGIVLSVCWDEANKRFISTENLGYFVTRWKRKTDDAFNMDNFLKRESFEVLEPSSFQQERAKKGGVYIQDVKRLEEYHPSTLLLSEPGICMVLVPADKAMDFVHAVKEKYQEQFGKVRDRLPIFMGLVFGHHRTPMRAMLEAGRSMMKMASSSKADWQQWSLVNEPIRHSTQYELPFENGIVWDISGATGDSNVNDEWYPRLFQADEPEQWKSIHVADLKKEKPVRIRPSLFDFEFLDTTSRRFSIYYDDQGQRPNQTRPYYLEDLDRLGTVWKFISHMARTQKYQVIRSIESTKHEWFGRDEDNQSRNDDVFHQFVEDTLAGATWPKDNPWRDIPTKWKKQIINAGVTGELTDMAELYMEIMKE